MYIQRITCEYLDTPLAVGSKHPRLGWILTALDTERGKKQSAYRILVASLPENLDKNLGDLWDTGQVTSESSTFISYNGKELQSRMLCYWKVKVWDEQKQESDWSAPSSWTMGIFPEDWKAEWVGERAHVSLDDRFPITKELEECPSWIRAVARREHPHGPGPENDFAKAIYLRKEFNIEKQISRAVARIAGLGYYELYLNGEKIGNHVLDPGATDYTKTVLYVSYDITNALKTADNCVGVILGNGWYWVGTPDLFGFEKAAWATPPKCRLELDITFTDGTSITVFTDKSWNCTDQGPIRFNCIRSGEVYDARMELGDWFLVGGVPKKDSKWKAVEILPAPLGILRPQLLPPIKIINSFSPCNQVMLPNGAIVFWFPHNNAGWVELTVRANEGQKIQIELNEILNKDGSVDMITHSGHTYGRYQTCEYTCKGNGLETYHPRFCYAGFQYVQITGTTLDQIVSIVAKQVCTSFEPAGEFNCSNLLINSVNDASKLTFLNGFHSYPQDCPQREKAGWTEDALISAHGSVYNFNAFLAYEKWIQDIIDAQHQETGQVPDIVPTPLWGKPTKLRNPKAMGIWTGEELGNMADPWWGGLLVMLPWKHYEHYGDKHILDIAYPAMKKYVDFLLRTTLIGENDYAYLINWSTMLGDWLEVGSGGSANRTPKILTSTQAFFRCVTIVANVSALLGKPQEEEHYRALTEQIKTAFNEEFLNIDTGLYCNDSQSAQAMSLVLGLVPKTPKGLEQKVFNQLADNVVNVRNGHLSTGIVGTYFLYKALSQFGRSDLALQVITAKGFPGFEHNLTRIKDTTPLPSTTLWEDWGGVSSLAHPVQGTVVSFFYEYLAGIRPIIGAPGFKRFEIAPQIIGNLLWVKSRLKTPFGVIGSYWQIEDKVLTLKVEIPVNTVAEVTLPCKIIENVLENKTPLKLGHGIEKIDASEQLIKLLLGSGTYSFTMPAP